MENNGDAVEDQGSGWFQVKKRHRTSSKFSIPSLTWGCSNKTYGFVRNQTSSNEKALNSHRKLPSLAPKGERVPANHMKADGQGSSTSSKDAQERAPSSHVQLDGEGTSTSSKDAGQDMHCLEKHVINQETEIPKPPFCSPTKTPGSDGGTSTAEGIPKTGNLVKIKWGDLEDDVLVPHGCHGNSNGVSEVKCNGIEDNHVADANLVMADDLVSHVSPCSAPQEEKECLAPVDAEQFPDAMCNSAVWTASIEGKCKMSCEISSENLEPSDVKGIAVTPNDAVGNPGETHSEPRCMEAGNSPRPDNPAAKNCSLSAIEGDGIIMEGEAHGLSDKSENGVLDISETTATVQVSDTGRDLEHSVPFHHQNGDPEASGEALVTSAMGDWRELQDSGVGENESGESKERFRQRLWCFLFENLNRAVDELYLLCELECDVEQMNEAILVLGEAASDFRELKSRVEGFEYVKRSPSQPSKDGSPANLKTDHRRPHALSWEVRRMASSPHRAEILSSSLEAFKKIQQERASKHKAHEAQGPGTACQTQHVSADLPQKSPIRNDAVPNTRELGIKTRKLNGISDLSHGNASGERKIVETSRLSKVVVQNSRLLPQSSSPSDSNISQVSMKSGPSAAGKGKKELLGSVSELEKQMTKKEKVLTETKVEKFPKSADSLRGHGPVVEKDKEKEKRNTTSFKSMDAWKEKRNWEDILAAPLRSSSRVSHSPGLSRKSMERARVLHDKLMSPEKKKKTALDMKREVEEKHARAMRIRSEIENERVHRLQRTSEKLNRVNEWQAVRSLKLREGMVARHQRSESRHEAYLAQVVRRAGDESSKVNEVRFITSLNEENKKLMLRQKLQGSELRRAEKLQVIRTKQKEDTAREEAVLERRKLLEAEKLQRLAETQRKKEEAQVRREEERRASSAAREAKAVEQLRRKQIRAKAQQEEAELLAQKLAERLSESEQRRKFYLEQIRERASMDFRDQSSPLFRRSSNKEGQGRSVSTNSVEDYQTTCMPGAGGSALGIGNGALQHSLKRRIKKIRQRLMALKYEFTEPPVGAESAGMGYRAQVGAARVKIGRWLQDLQRLRQARKEGAASIGLIIGDMIKFLEGKDSELHASRQAGLLDFIASALPASHTSKPEAYQVTIHLLRLLRVVLYIPANRSYFLAQNLLPPLIPMLSAALENYIKIAASLNAPGNTNSVSVKTSVENLESISEVMEGFLWTVTTILGHICSDERQLQMRDGLMELLVAYQVIHRLRDLFALYDRPQVEGSPFPSSILLSLNLLAVLTSRSGSLSSIDWESYLAKVTSANKIEEAKLRESSVSGVVRDASVVNDTVGDQKLPQASHLMVGLPLHDEEKLSTNSVALPLCDVPEDRPLDESCRLSVHEEPSPHAQDPGREFTDTAVELGSVGATSHKCTKDISGESSGSVIEELAKASLSQKDVRNISYTITEQNAQNEDITADLKNGNGQGISLSQPVAFLISAVAETGLVCLPSLLTAVLLQANNRLSSEQGSYVLPSNFEEVATGVLKVLNNLALLDISVLQSMLARPDLKMEFFHLMSFLLSHCTSKWKVASDQVGLLLLESLLLLGYFALFHPGNQAVLRWGKSPTILHKVCDLPFAFFSDPELTPILAGTLIASCYECEQNRGVVQQELSMEMLLSLIKSCGQAIQSDSSPPDNVMTDDPCDQWSLEPRKLQADFTRSSRGNLRSARNLSGKGAVVGSNPRVRKVKNQRDAKGTKTCDDWAFKHNLPALEISSSFMLHSRFPSSFIDRAEEFFSAGSQL